MVTETVRTEGSRSDTPGTARCALGSPDDHAGCAVSAYYLWVRIPNSDSNSMAKGNESMTGVVVIESGINCPRFDQRFDQRLAINSLNYHRIQRLIAAKRSIPPSPPNTDHDILINNAY